MNRKIYNVRLMTAAASDPNWPASMTDQGEVIDRTAFKGLNIDGCSVRYIEDQGLFSAVHGVNIADVNSYSVVWGFERRRLGMGTERRAFEQYPRTRQICPFHLQRAEPYYVDDSCLMIYQNGGQYSKTAWPTRMVPYSFRGIKPDGIIAGSNEWRAPGCSPRFSKEI